MTAMTLDSSTALVSRARTVAFGLICGGASLLIMSLWLGNKHEDLPFIWSALLAVISALGIGLGVWQFVRTHRMFRDKSVDPALLAKDRQVIGLFLVIVGIATMCGGLALGLKYGLAGLGQSVGLFLFGLVALFAGRAQFREPAPADAYPFLEYLRARHSAVATVLLIAGAGLFIAAVGYALLFKPGWVWAPAIGAAILLGLLAAICGIWLNLTPPESVTLAIMRVLILIFGGVAGLILALAALAQAIIWKEDVFLSGMSGWQGENGWRLWACAYVELIGLALMYGSLLLAKADIRTSAILRRTLYGYNTVLTGLLLLATLIVGNIVFYAMVPYTFDWTRTRGFHTLSISTKNLLTALEKPVNVYVLSTEQNPIYKDLRTLFTNCQVEQPEKFRVIYVNPDQDFNVYGDLAQRFPEILPDMNAVARREEAPGRGVLVVLGDLPADINVKIPHSFIPDRKLFEIKEMRDSDQMKGTLIFRGEDEVMKELSFLAQGREKRKLYFLQGNDELDINQARPTNPRPITGIPLERMGAGEFVDRLKKDNFEVKGLTFAKNLPKGADNIVQAPETGPDKRREIPEDAATLLILGPSQPLGKDALDAIERYMDRGGQMFVCLDMVTEKDLKKGLKATGLEEFLKKYGAQVTDELVMRVPENRGDPQVIVAVVPPACKVPFARSFADQPMRFETARIIRPENNPKFDAEVILQTHPRQNVFGDKSILALVDPVRHLIELDRRGVLETRLSREPLPIALAVSSSGKPRMVVFGDAEFLSNQALMMTELKDEYYGFAVSALEWMAERPSREGPRPKESNFYSLNPDKFNINRMLFLPVWVMSLGIIGLGAGVWIIRRR